MSLTQKIKDYSKKILFPLMIAATLSGCSYVQKQQHIEPEARTKIMQNYNEEKQETKSEIEEMIKQYDKRKDQVRKEFGKSIEDGYFSIEEQERIMGKYTQLESLQDSIDTRVYKYRWNEKFEYGLSESDSNLVERLNSNLHEVDFGPALQKDFENMNIPVKVEGRTTGLEGIIYFFGGFTAMAISGAIAASISYETRQKRYGN